jgi:hypothetical protein
MSRWEDEARRLADELENRAAGRGTLDPQTKDYLVREFADRLDAADDPEKMLGRWYGNIDRYVDRTVGPGRRILPTSVTPEDIQRQFFTCSDVCPPPLAVGRGRSRSGQGYGP